jgi:hypothetical protein
MKQGTTKPSYSGSYSVEVDYAYEYSVVWYGGISYQCMVIWPAFLTFRPRSCVLGSAPNRDLPPTAGRRQADGVEVPPYSQIDTYRSSGIVISTASKSEICLPFQTCLILHKIITPYSHPYRAIIECRCFICFAVPSRLANWTCWTFPRFPWAISSVFGCLIIWFLHSYLWI